MNSFWTVLERISVVVTVLGLPYLVVSYRKRVPRFSFSFAGKSVNRFERDKLEWVLWKFAGTIRNQSLDENTIERIYLVVWRGKRRKDTYRFGHGGIKDMKCGEEKTQLPIKFGPREAKALNIEIEIPLTGTQDINLMNQIEIIPGPIALGVPKHHYELAFEDVVGNLFDERGRLINRKGVNLRWTLNNSIERAKDGKPWTLLRHIFLIIVSDMIFSIRRLIRRIGI